MIVAIDGKSGTGKSTIAKMVSNILGYLLVETGAIYREIAFLLVQNGISYPEVSNVLPLLNYSVVNNCLILSSVGKHDDLGDERYGRMAANLGKHNEIKKIINTSIRGAIGNKNAVVEGRNTATQLYPNAEVKILLDADIETRANRRYNQLNGTITIEEIVRSLGYRDETIEICSGQYNEIINTSIFDVNDSVAKIIRWVYKTMHKMSIIELKHFLYAAYQHDTAYKTCVSTWSRKNPTLGHCAVTAMIVNEYFGGDIQFGYYEKENVWHYWNVIDGEVVDFTAEQFQNDAIQFKNIQNTTFAELFEHESVRSRYVLLKERMQAIQTIFWETNEKILACSSCKNAHSPAYWTVSLGRDCRVLIVGEAPAKNGWRITGKAWINEKGELVPTGKILRKLLRKLDLDIADVSYLEAIKCYPEKGKVTKEQQQKCKHFCCEQIGLLKPRVILSMGKYATEYLLGDDNKFSDVVGKQFLINTEYGDYLLIPIYHTSPASPLAYKGNVAIFDSIKQVLDSNEHL